MCGIAGFLTVDGRAEYRPDLDAMRASIRHRGPDGEAAWVSTDGRCGLAHARLAIIDLSEAGAQPMRSHDGRLTITFNGEIYNYPELRREMEARRGRIAWRGGSDTEVLLELIAEVGLVRALRAADGMYAFALHDASDGSLCLARDVGGEKPLYYRHDADRFLFGSEVPAVGAGCHGRDLTLDREAGLEYLATGYFRRGTSVFKEVRQLAPGEVLRVRPDPGGVVCEPMAMLEAVTVPTMLRDPAAAEDEIERALAAAVRSRLIADVPVGVFLSGGIDSGLVATFAARSGARLRAFTIGFQEPEFDESGHARQLAGALGIEHHVEVVTIADVKAMISELPRIYGQPLGDPSQLPTVLLSRFAGKHVKVALGGDAGDEVFGGYNRHVMAARLARIFALLPSPARRTMARGVRAMPQPWLDAIGRMLPIGGVPRHELGHKLFRLASLLEAPTLREAYGRALSHLDAPEMARLGIALEAPASAARSLLRLAMHHDFANYMPEDVFVKVDRASMRFGIETRAPFLARDVLAQAARLPDSSLVSGGQNKIVLRSIARRVLPAGMADLPKKGFAVPIADWIRGELAGDVEGALRESTALGSMVDASALMELFEQHRRRDRNWSYFLWNAFMFACWERERVRISAK